MAKSPVSAVIIAFNAERLLADVLTALQWCDEIVVVDSHSTDATARIAATGNARVVQRAFDDFGTQKAFAVDQARNNWVLVVDADEIVTPGLAEEIQAVVAQATHGEESRIGFDMRISLVFLGREMRGGEARRRSLRLFDRRRGNFTPARVHERLVLDGPIGHLEHNVLHHSYASLEEYFEKFNRYTSAGAADLAARGSTAGVGTIVFRFPITFVRQYLFRGNILNGYPGFLWSLLSAVYPVVKYAKLHELRRGK